VKLNRYVRGKGRWAVGDAHVVRTRKSWKRESYEGNGPL
jgi:hypothetical protein